MLVAVIFLGFAWGVNWVASSQEKSDMKQSLQQAAIVEKGMTKEIEAAKRESEWQARRREELEAEYKNKIEEKKRVEEALRKIEDVLAIAEKKLVVDKESLKEQAREDVRGEIDELKNRIIALQEAKERFEAEAEARAKEAAAIKQDMEFKLQREEELRRKAENELREKTDAIARLEAGDAAAAETTKAAAVQKDSGQEQWVEEEYRSEIAELKNRIIALREAKERFEAEAEAIKQDMELKLQREEELRRKAENELREKRDVIAGLEAGSAAATGAAEAVAQKGSGHEQGVEEDYRGEIAELKNRIIALQEEKQRFEAEAKTEVEARKRAEVALANKTEVESLLKRDYLRSQLETDLKIKTTEIAMLERGVIDLKGDIDQKTKQFEELEARYKAEVEEKKKTAELLTMAEEARRAAEKRLESEREVLKSAAKEGAEMDKLNNRILEIESANKKIEAEARKRVEEALVNKTELESLLKREEELRQKAEADLKTKIDEIERLGKEAEATKKIAAKGSEAAAAKAEESIADKTAGAWQALPKSEQGITAVELKAGDNWQEEVVIKYTVTKGDSLWKIAGRESIYNAPKLWVVIYKYNHDKLKNPNSLYPGQVLLIPKMVTTEDAVDSFLKAKAAIKETI